MAIYKFRRQRYICEAADEADARAKLKAWEDANKVDPPKSQIPEQLIELPE